MTEDLMRIHAVKRQTLLGIGAIVFSALWPAGSYAIEVKLNADTPISFTEAQGTQGDAFNAQCSACVSGLPEPIGLSFNGFDLGPVGPAAPTVGGSPGEFSETLGGDFTFELNNPDGSNLVYGYAEGGSTITIEAVPGKPNVLLQVAIPAPVPLDILGTKVVSPDPIFIDIFGAATNNVSIADIGPPYITCGQPGTAEFCTESFLSFTLDATVVVSTSPLSYSAAFPPSTGSGAVPEPSTWLMLLLGFGGLAWGARITARRAAPTFVVEGSLLRGPAERMR
jgi:PEP-CTERM motif